MVWVPCLIDFGICASKEDHWRVPKSLDALCDTLPPLLDRLLTLGFVRCACQRAHDFFFLPPLLSTPAVVTTECSHHLLPDADLDAAVTGVGCRGPDVSALTAASGLPLLQANHLPLSLLRCWTQGVDVRRDEGASETAGLAVHLLPHRSLLLRSLEVNFRRCSTIGLALATMSLHVCRRVSCSPSSSLPLTPVSHDPPSQHSN